MKGVAKWQKGTRKPAAVMWRRTENNKQLALHNTQKWPSNSFQFEIEGPRLRTIAAPLSDQQKMKWMLNIEINVEMFLKEFLNC